MILSLAFAGTAGIQGAAGVPGAWPVALLAALAYAAAAWPSAAERRFGTVALNVAWLLHALLLVMDLTGGFGASDHSARIGFAPVLSLTVWLVLAVHSIESRFLPLPAVRQALAVAGVIAVVLALVFPGERHLTSTSPWAPLHWLLGVASYGLFGAAVLHALLLDSAERQMRQRSAPEPLGMPLLRLERLTFRFVEAGFAVLTIALVMGMLTAARWRWDHKSVFSLLGWGVFAALLAGRLWRGWRGRRATRWLYVGAGLLLLAYAGSRFVLEVILGRGGA
jgi:ABC-type uncharacterized transport system permease subunit